MRLPCLLALATLCGSITLSPAWAGDPAPSAPPAPQPETPSAEPAPPPETPPAETPTIADLAPRSPRQRLCESGDGAACRSLADAFSAAGDYLTAMSYLDRACTLSDSQGCADAASAYLTGNYHGTDCTDLEPCLLIDLDLDKGFTFAQKSCAEQNALGCYLKGFAYENGLGTTQSHLTAVAVWRQNCKKRADGHSCVEMGMDPPMPRLPKEKKPGK